ncbi:MAG: flippase-like domain-containing protein [Planctomycetes bacterium]|nr:flippase-like domain-containing protein [Planctomycetota bacterium]
MSVRTKQILKLAAKLSVAALLLAWVFSQVGFEQFRATAQAARWHYLVGVWLATVLFSLLQAYALRIILRKQDCEVGLHTLFATTCVTAYYSLFLPGIVSTGVKWYILKRSTGKGVNVLSSMLYNQATLAVVMVVAGLVALVLAVPTQAAAPDAGRSSFLPVVCIVLAVFIIGLSILVLNERTGGLAIRLLMAALKPWPRWVQEKGRAMLEQIAVFQTAGWRFHSIIALINLIDGLLVGLLLYFLAARAASVIVPLGALVWLCAVVFVLGKIPITIANLGVREVTLVGLLGLYGVTKPAALLMSMVMFSGLVFLGLLGAVYQLYWSAKR